MAIDAARFGNDASHSMIDAPTASSGKQDDVAAGQLTLIGQYDSPFVRRVAVALRLLALQIRETLVLLEQERHSGASPFWFGSSPTHADVAVACSLRFLSEAHPELADSIGPALRALATRCEELPAFRAVVQPILVPQ